jgi:hypothetical protein
MSDLVHRSVYQHAARPEWGGAIIAWERDGKRGYQFEDGRLRIFTTGHYHLLEQIRASTDRVRTLRALLGLPVETAPEANPPAPDAPTLDEQVEYFLAIYPGGFTGQRWRAERRGGAGQPRRRHRDPAIALARKQLTAAYLSSCLERLRDDEGIAVLAKVLGETDLVPPVHVPRLLELPPNRARAVLIGLFDLLFGRASAEVRMVQWVQALTRGTGRKPTWSLATAPLALVCPDQHICVHRPSFVAQATAMGLRPRVAVSPSGNDYAPLLAIAERVRAHLTASECAPADLLDVHDFMLLTLGAAAAKEIAARREIEPH